MSGEPSSQIRPNCVLFCLFKYSPERKVNLRKVIHTWKLKKKYSGPGAEKGDVKVNDQRSAVVVEEQG